MNATKRGALYASISNPNVSITPPMYNAAFQELGMACTYISLEVTDLAAAIETMRAHNIKGYSVSRPFKQAVIPFLDELTPRARAIGAVNVVKNYNGRLAGYNSDWAGAIIALRKYTSLPGKEAAILGAGGAARAIAYGLKAEGARVVVYNRTRSRGHALSLDLGVSFGGGLNAIDEICRADLIVNATDVGSIFCPEKVLLPVRALRANHVVFDAVFCPTHTNLLLNAITAGSTPVRGAEMLLYQGAVAFEIFTDHPAPIATMLSALRQQLHTLE